ncbi:hypothetical protein V5799_021820, partial [Amblyomma americanum]
MQEAESSQDTYQHPETFTVEVCIVTTKEYRDRYSNYVAMVTYFGSMLNSSAKVIRYFKSRNKVKHVNGKTTLNRLSNLINEDCFRICDAVILIT